MRRLVLAVATAALLVVGPANAGVHRRVLGHSVDGREIVAYELGDPASSRRVLVVGCVHGNEPAGIAITSALVKQRTSLHGVDLWIVPSFNPDGQAAGTRGNANGVDLNRNFPWRWQPLTGIYDSGPHALSEPESRLIAALVRRLRPAISIWFHQHLDVVDVSGGDAALERRFAGLVGMTPAVLTREPGSIVTWENHLFPKGTAFVVELPAGSLSAAEAGRFARAVRAISP
jgi:protein MpaA